MPNSTLGRSNDRSDPPGPRDDPSYVSPETIAPQAGDTANVVVLDD